MLLVPTLSHPPTLLWPRSKQGLWLPRQKRASVKMYGHLDPNHLFEPVAIQTSGAFGPSTMVFLEELGSRLKQVMGEANARSYLYQRLSMAVQRGNAASIMGTTSPSSDLADFFSRLHFLFSLFIAYNNCIILLSSSVNHIIIYIYITKT